MKKTVINLLRTAATKYKNDPYTTEKNEQGWVSKTYSQMDEDTSYVAAALMENGFSKNDKISILSEGRTNWVMGELSAFKAGVIVVPLSIKLLPEEALFRVNHSDSRAILVSQVTFEKVAQVFSKFEHPDFKLIYLDDDLSKITTLLEIYSIDAQKDIILFSQLLKQGKEIWAEKKEKVNEFIESIEEEDIATISYTSGTTGNPKGIMLSQYNYYYNSNDAIKWFNLEEKLKTLVILPIDHAFAHTVGIHASLIRGINICFVDARGGAVNLLKNIPINLKEIKPDYLLTVPALTANFMKKIQEGIEAKGAFAKYIFMRGMQTGMQINQDGYRKAGFITKLINYPYYKFADALVFSKVREIFGGKLKFCVGGGAYLDIRQQKFYYTLGIPIYQGYGLTESAPVISTNTGHTHKLGTSGKPLPGLECKVVNDNKECAVNQIGEIIVKGDNVMSGYYKNPSATAETLHGEWLHTGDRGYLDDDGFLYVVGREKALLISQDGEKYSPEEIEEAISNSSNYISQIMLWNDHSRYTAAVITLEEAKIKSLIKSKGYTKAEDVVREIEKSFYHFKKLKEYKRKFQVKWIPSVFTILDEPFTENNKMINSTMKMVRYKIAEIYEDKFNRMFEAGFKSNGEENIETIRKKFNLE